MGLIKRNRIAYGTPILDDNVTQGSSNGVKSSGIWRAIQKATNNIVTGTLTAGQTSITLNSVDITADSVLDAYTSIYGVNPLTMLASAGEVTLTFNAQATDMTVGVEIKR